MDTYWYPSIAYLYRSVNAETGAFMQRFGEKLRLLRTQHNVTLRDLATRLGYTTHGYVNAVEKGRKKPSLDFVLKVAQLFNVTADQLLRDDIDLGSSSDSDE